MDIFPIDGAPQEGLERHYEDMCRKREWISRLCPFYKVVGKDKTKWFFKYCLKRLRYPHLGNCATIKAGINAVLRACRFEDTPLAGAYFGDDDIREFMPREWFESYTELEFEGRRYPAITTIIFAVYLVITCNSLPMDSASHTICMTPMLSTDL